MSGKGSGKGGSSTALNEADRLYAIDAEKLNILKNNKDFLRDPKYFKSVRIGPSASMKMMMHVCDILLSVEFHPIA